MFLLFYYYVWFFTCAHIQIFFFLTVQNNDFRQMEHKKYSDDLQMYTNELNFGIK